MILMNLFSSSKVVRSLAFSALAGLSRAIPQLCSPRRPAYTGFSSLIPEFRMENKAVLISLGQQIVFANHLDSVLKALVKKNAV